MKNTWKTITFGALISLANLPTPNAKQEPDSSNSVARKLAKLKRQDLMAMMERSDCRCLARKQNSGLDISPNPAGSNG